jgi:hypothetical protein
MVMQKFITLTQNKNFYYDYVRALFDYKDGELYWKQSKGNSKAGCKAGTIDKINKYCYVKINNKRYQLHRIIFLYHHGYQPIIIDHIDGNGLNNKIENLREATATENQYNSKIRKDNTSGIKGVNWNKIEKKWHVKFQVNGKSKFFGRYYDLNVAKFVCETMRHKYHNKFCNNG